MELYLVRHGQSLSNAGTERPDPPLTETGKEQARLAGEALKASIEEALEVPTE